jgi:single-strand DNA-binding protein
MSSYNKVILMGNLTRDPELRFTQSNVAICKFGLAVNRRFKDQSGEWRDEATFVDVTIFGKRGEAFAKFHTKGKQAFIEGSLRFDTWEDSNGGGKRSKLYVVADTWEFVGGQGGPGGGGGGGGGGAQGGAQYNQAQSSQDGGQGGGQNAGQAGGQGNYQREPQGGYGQPQPEYLEVDDTPF